MSGTQHAVMAERRLLKFLIRSEMIDMMEQAENRNTLETVKDRDEN